MTDYDFWINWGDMTPPEKATGDNPDPSHTYDAADTFTVQITGTFPHFYLNGRTTIKDKLLSVEQWGNIAWESMANTFNGASKLTLNATDTPVLSGVMDMSFMFLFARAFNQDIGGWNVSNVENMSNMFNNAHAFNQDIGGWNVSNVENMSNMFNNAHAFNQDIGNWSVDSVTNMDRMFFNARAFNQDIGDWNVSGVTDMTAMFNSAIAFNQDIGDWNVSSVTNMLDMFASATAFNQDISGWNVSNVTNMSAMFENAFAFNQDISGWNVSNVTNMSAMFENAFAFNQDISGWNVSKVTTMGTMLDGSGLSTYHYEELLIAWNKLELQKNVPLGATDKQYRIRAQTARNSLINIHKWSINDGGLKDENDAPTLTAPLPDTAFAQGFSSYEIPIATLFTDGDGDPLTLSVVTDGDMAIGVALANDMLTLTESGTGVDSIIITATDEFSAQATDTFLVTVKNNPPRIANALDDLTLEKGFKTHEIDISNVFEDEQPLAISVKLAMEGVITAVISSDTLTLTEVDTGSTNIIVTASDGALQVMDTFLVTIENDPPRIANALADLTLEKGFGTHPLDISNVFEDEQPLTISVKLATEGVITAVISSDTLTLTEVDTGSTNIIVTASDGALQVMDTFLVTVGKNAPPRIAKALADLILDNGFVTHDLDLSNAFEDEQPLMFSVKVATEGVITAVISGDTLTLTEVDTGATHVIVTASDGLLVTTDTFLVTIENAPPRIANALVDLTLEKGFATHEIDISKIFEDEQPLTISVKVATEGVITAVISGNTLTLTEMGIGKTEVMLIASDGVLQTTDTFLVTVNEATDLITAVEVGKEWVKLYPNPTVGTVSLDLGNVRKALMKVYTLQGGIILEKVLLENTYNIELPGSAGIYLVEIITTNNRQIIKLVKE